MPVPVCRLGLTCSVNHHRIFRVSTCHKYQVVFSFGETRMCCGPFKVQFWHSLVMAMAAPLGLLPLSLGAMVPPHSREKAATRGEGGIEKGREPYVT